MNDTDIKYILLNFICKECGLSKEELAPVNLNGRLYKSFVSNAANNICQGCYYWLRLYESNCINNKHVIINNNCYYLGDEISYEKGFGGKKFIIGFMDGRLIETTNLWHNGIVPMHFRDRIKDNAKFLPEEYLAYK